MRTVKLHTHRQWTRTTTITTSRYVSCQIALISGIKLGYATSQTTARILSVALSTFTLRASTGMLANSASSPMWTTHWLATTSSTCRAPPQNTAPICFMSLFHLKCSELMKLSRNSSLALVDFQRSAPLWTAISLMLPLWVKSLRSLLMSHQG